MKLATFIIAAVGSRVASTQALGGLPSCVISCVGGAIPKTGCLLTDFACICKTKTFDEVMEVAGACLRRQCDADEEDKLKQLCNTLAWSASHTASDSSPAPTHANSPPLPTHASSSSSPTRSSPPPSSSAVSQTAAKSSETAVATDAANSKPQSGSSSSNKLSPGAIAGIAIGAIGGFVLVLIVAFLFFKYKKLSEQVKRNSRAPELESARHTVVPQPEEARYHKDQHEKAELEGHSNQQRAELE